MGGVCIHIHVDQCGSIPGGQKTITVRNHPDENEMSVLDGVHVDFGGHDVLSSVVGIPKASVRRRSLYLYAGLGKHGSLLDNSYDFDFGS